MLKQEGEGLSHLGFKEGGWQGQGPETTFCHGEEEGGRSEQGKGGGSGQRKGGGEGHGE